MPRTQAVPGPLSLNHTPRKRPTDNGGMNMSCAPAVRPVLGAVDNSGGQARSEVTNADTTQLADAPPSHSPLCAQDKAAVHTSNHVDVPVVVKQEPVDDRVLLDTLTSIGEEVHAPPSEGAATPMEAVETKPSFVDFLRSALDAGVAAQTRERKLEQDVARLQERLRTCKVALREKQRGEAQAVCSNSE